MSAPPLPPKLDDATRRALAAGLYNRTWELMGLPARTPEQDAEMLHAAHASRHHWGEIAGSPARLWRGEWLCSRVYAVLGRAEPSLWHARRALDLLDAADGAGSTVAEDWDRPAIFEALARASFVAGDAEEGAAWKARAADLASNIAEADDREIIQRDLASLPA